MKFLEQKVAAQEKQMAEMKDKHYKEKEKLEIEIANAEVKVQEQQLTVDKVDELRQQLTQG